MIQLNIKHQVYFSKNENVFKVVFTLLSIPEQFVTDMIMAVATPHHT